MIYLDNAATSLIKPVAVQNEMIKAMNMAASPGRGGHRPALYASEIVYNCRETASKLFNVKEPEQVVFTMNASHALNIAINSLATKGTKVLVSGYEHNSVTRPLTEIGAEIKIAASPLFDKNAALEAFRENIDWAELVVCTHVSNVFGFVLPVYEIAQLCRQHGVPMIVDASQAAGILDVDFEKLAVDFVAMPGHKSLFGPQGTGILLCANGGKPLIYGGSGSDSRSQKMPEFLPDRLEAGTHNVTGLAGLNAGMNYVLCHGLEKIRKHEEMLLGYTADKLSYMDGIKLYTGDKAEQCGALSFNYCNFDCEVLAQMLAEEGVCVRAGLHCSPYAHRSAGTLETGTVRISFSPFVSLENARNFCEVLQKLLKSKL